MEWVRGKTLGHGSFATVSLAKKHGSNSFLAVKTCDYFNSDVLQHEKEILSELNGFENVIKCFGVEESVENGKKLFNLLLEYASGGNLAQYVKNNGGSLQEFEVKKFTRSILKGLRNLHSKGFAHCDIKLQNLLLNDDGELKIADFGLAKKIGEKSDKFEVRGTPMYIAPESVNDNEYDSGCDIWALGCAVIEMVTGKSVWNCKADVNVAALLFKIGVSDELPEIPEKFSDDGKDFLSKIFVKDPRKRWSADMLLNHPFVSDVKNGDFRSGFGFDSTVTLVSSSPRCPFDFQDSISDSSSELWSSNQKSESRFDWSSLSNSTTATISSENRIQQLTSDQICNWELSESWITVR